MYVGTIFAAFLWQGNVTIEFFYIFGHNRRKIAGNVFVNLFLAFYNKLHFGKCVQRAI